MFKIAGVALILAAGGLGYMAYDAYRERNKFASGINDTFKDAPLKIEVKKETPPKTLWGGIGAAACLVVGGVLVAKK
ncbi:MAG: hypothetical protein KIS92_15690 [Planctomycetota bacterium]|nr:hypothetical protein [Planctomycetota bacterium]